MLHHLLHPQKNLRHLPCHPKTLLLHRQLILCPHCLLASLILFREKTNIKCLMSSLPSYLQRSLTMLPVGQLRQVIKVIPMMYQNIQNIKHYWLLMVRKHSKTTQKNSLYSHYDRFLHIKLLLHRHY